MSRFSALSFVAILLAVSGCGKDPDARATAGESRVTAKAVADVDAAIADAQKAALVPPPAPIDTAAETPEEPARKQ